MRGEHGQAVLADDLSRVLEAEHLGEARVGVQHLAPVVDHDPLERRLCQPAEAGLALAEPVLGLPLLGDVDAGADDQLHLPLVVHQHRAGPLDEPALAALGQPDDGVLHREHLGLDGLQGLLDPLDLLRVEEQLPDVPPLDLVGGVLDGRLTGPVEAQDAAPRVQHDDQRRHRVQQGRGEVGLQLQGVPKAPPVGPFVVALAHGIPQPPGSRCFSTTASSEWKPTGFLM